MHWDRRGVLLALGACAASAAAAQATPDPAAPVRRLEAALAGTATALPSAAAVRAAVARSFDTAGIARAVLAGLAPGATAAQVERFRQALTQRMARDMLRRRRQDGRGTLVILGSRALAGGQWLVTSRLTLPSEGDRVVSWRISTGPGGPVISDVIGGGSSLIRQMRNEYGPALRRLGLDRLIARMEASGGR